MTITLLLAGVAPTIIGRLITVWADWIKVNTYTVGKLAYTWIIPEDERKSPDEKYKTTIFYEDERVEPIYKIVGKIIDAKSSLSFGSFLSPLDKRFLDNLRIKANTIIQLEEIEIIPLDEEKINDIEEKKKRLEEQWRKFEEENRFTLDREIKIVKLDDKKKNIRRLLFRNSDEESEMS